MPEPQNWVAVMWVAFGLGGLVAVVVSPWLVFGVGVSLALICKAATP